MGFFRWLGSLFGRKPAPGPASGAQIVQADLLRQLQSLVQALGGADWFYWRNAQRLGPFTLVQLQQMLAAGQLTPTDQVWREGLPQLVTLASVLPVAFDPSTAMSLPEWAQAPFMKVGSGS